MEFLFWMALGAGVLALTNHLSALRRFTNARFMAPRYVVAAPGAVSDDIQALLQGPIDTLPGHWERLAWVQVTSLAHRPALPAALFGVAGGGTVVLVQPANYPEPGARVVLSFMSWRASGELVMTTSELHLWLLRPARTALEDPMALDAVALWHRHRQRTIDCGRLEATPEALLADLEARYQQTVAAMLSRGALSQTEGPDALRYTLAGAWPEVSAVRQATVKALALQDRRRERLRPRPPSRAELVVEVEAGYRASPVARPRDARRRLLVLAGSAVVAALSFTVWVPLSKVGLLLLVILFHELGHLWAMRTFGYTDTSLFFVPFFGGAAAGQKTDASAAERVIVALMGPLPGLLLAIALAAIYPMFGAPELLWDIIWMLFLINLFNLTPLLPLDGGHVVTHLLVARWPGAETILRGLGVAGFLALGALDPIFLVVAAFGILSWRSQSRLSRMSRALSAELSGAAEPRLRVRALAWLYAHGGDRATFAVRLARVQGVELRGSVGALTPRMAWTLGAIYLGLLIGAPLALRALV